MYGYRLNRGRRSTRSVSVPQLTGGINAVDPANLIDDNELSDGLNVWEWDGRLVRRPPQLNAFKSYFRDINVEKIMINDDFIVAFGIGMNSAMLNDKVVAIVENGIENSVRYIVNEGYTKERYPLVAFSNYGETYEYPLVYARRTVTAYLKNKETKTLAPYAPMVLVNGRGVANLSEGSANGNPAEPLNHLTGHFKAQFTTDGEGIYFFSPYKDLATFGAKITVMTDEGEKVFSPVVPSVPTLEYGFLMSDPQEIKMGGETISVSVAVSTQGGYFYFFKGSLQAVALPSTGISSNVTAEFVKERTGEDVSTYTLQWRFGGDRSSSNAGTRLFLANSTEDESKIIWSDVNDPTYFPESNYARVNGKITQLSQLGESLIVFTPDDIYAMQYVSRQVEDLMFDTAYFPISHISNGIGCSGANARKVNNRIVWAETSENKVYALYNYNNFSDRNVVELPVKVKASNFASHSAAVVGNYYVSGSVVLDCSSWNKPKAWIWSFPTETISLYAKDGKLYRPSMMRVYSVDFANPYDTIQEDFDPTSAKNTETINAHFRSKLYDFGVSHLIKKITKVFFTFLPKGNNDSSAPLGKVYFIGSDNPVVYPRAIGSPLLNRLTGILRYFPRVRNHFFGISVALNCYAEIQELNIEYEIQGEAR